MSSSYKELLGFLVCVFMLTRTISHRRHSVFGLSTCPSVVIFYKFVNVISYKLLVKTSPNLQLRCSRGHSRAD